MHQKRRQSVYRGGHILDVLNHKQNAKHADVKLLQASLALRLGEDGLDVIVDELFQRLVEIVEWNEQTRLLFRAFLCGCLEGIQ